MACRHQTADCELSSNALPSEGPKETTMNAQTRREVRYGLVALALSGLMFTLGIVMRGPVSLSDPGACCRAAPSPAYLSGWTIILLALVVDLYGFLGLYRYLTYQAESRTAFLGLVLIIPGLGFLFPLASFFAVNAPAIAQLYQQGDQGVIAVVAATFVSPLGAAVQAIHTLAVIGGAILFAVATWRDGRLPRWTAVLLALSIVLLAIPATFANELLGALLLFIGAGAMA